MSKWAMKKESDYEMHTAEPVKAGRNSKYQVTSYSKLVVPVSMRSIYWQFFGFPATSEGDIISKTRIVCILCRRQIAYNRNTSNLRMHLQNRHINELSAIEPGASAPKSTKMTSLRDVVDAALDGKDDDMDGEQGYIETQDSQKSNELLELTSESYVYETPSPAKRGRKKSSQHVQHVPKNNLLSVTSNYIIADLRRPDIVDEVGYQRLLLNIENPCSIPTREMVGLEIIPKIYNSTKEKLLDELHSFTGFMSVTLEEWQCSENRWYVTVSVYYPQTDRNIVSKVLKTFAFFPQMDAAMWESMLSAVFMDWSIMTDQVTAVVCTMEREAMVEALYNLGFTPVPCLDATVKECVRQCLSNETIVDILQKIRQQISFLMNNPLTAKAVQQYMAAEEVPALQLDVDAVWLSTLDMLEVAIQWKDIGQKVVESVFTSPMNPGFEVGEEEWDIIQDLVTVLQPLKMTLMSIKEEKMPFISIVRPMLWQVTENKLNVQGEESETALNLKKATVDLLNYRFADHRVTPVLDSATVIDPRFKLMAYNSETDKLRIREQIHNEIKDIVVQATEPAEEENSSKKRVSNMQLLLGEFKSPKVKMDTDGSSRLEYQTYLSQPEEMLDVDPTTWWWRSREKFPRLSHTADKYLCVPAVATLPSYRTAENPVNFHQKRATMVPELVDKLIFLHMNHNIT